ncbi:MAG: SRPBCC family protein [Dyadobacter sp.]|uniref:SRPBCC family protein n=1 Tax=Dyadobacter sp. TaxID=1914288 RepID=UPI0032644479
MPTNRQTAPVTAEMLIRKPAKDVFNAFIDPEQTRNFWFTKGSGMLEKGEVIIWEWEMYGIAVKVSVQEIIAEKLIVIEWGEPATTVEFNFEQTGDQATYVTIANFGFMATGEQLIKVVNDNTGGFTTVLDGLKAYMEHGINLNLIADKFPKDVTAHK